MLYTHYSKLRINSFGPSVNPFLKRNNMHQKNTANQRRADQLSRMQGKALLRRGQFKID